MIQSLSYHGLILLRSAPGAAQRKHVARTFVVRPEGITTGFSSKNTRYLSPIVAEVLETWPRRDTTNQDILAVTAARIEFRLRRGTYVNFRTHHLAPLGASSRCRCETKHLHNTDVGAWCLTSATRHGTQHSSLRWHQGISSCHQGTAVAPSPYTAVCRG